MSTHQTQGLNSRDVPANQTLEPFDYERKPRLLLLDEQAQVSYRRIEGDARKRRPSRYSKDELGEFGTLSEELVKGVLVPRVSVEAYCTGAVRSSAGTGSIPGVGRIVMVMEV